MKRITLIVMLMLFYITSHAQEKLNVLNYDSYIQHVMEYHPYAYRASIAQSMGDSKVTQSRGAFDPKLFGDINQKYFDHKQYYSHINGGIKIPTWFGLSAEAGYQINDGVYLNPEARLPGSGLWYAGLRLELGNGLIIDQRRAEFEKAKLYQTNSKLERILMLNELNRDASIAFWKWQQAYQELGIYQLAYENSVLRLEAIKDVVQFGDRPNIDIVEATINVQTRELSLNAAKTKFKNAELNLEIYLWSDGFLPLELENTIPAIEIATDNDAVQIELDSLISNHPYLQMNALRIEETQVDLQLKKEQLKPQFTLKYNAITEPIGGNPFSEYSPSNYTWGATFSYPLLSRKERGGLQLAKLKLEDQSLKNKSFAVEIEYKINAALNNYLLSLQQLELNEALVNNNQKMYDSEKSLFELGESSVFMINSRETTWLTYQIQLIKLQNESKILYTDYIYALMIGEI